MFLSCYLFEVLNSVLSWFKVQLPSKFVIKKKKYNLSFLKSINLVLSKVMSNFKRKHFLITLLITLVINGLKKREPISPQAYKFKFTTVQLNGNLQFNKRTLKAT